MDTPSARRGTDRTAVFAELRRLIDIAMRADPGAKALDSLRADLGRIADAAAPLVADRFGSVHQGRPVHLTDRPLTAMRTHWQDLSPVTPPLELRLKDGAMTGRIAFPAAYEGPPGRAHGGFIAAALDHAMGVYTSAIGRTSFTRTLSLEFFRAIPLGAVATITLGHRDVDGRRTTVWARVEVDEEICAEASGLFITMRKEHVTDSRQDPVRR